VKVREEDEATSGGGEDGNGSAHGTFIIGALRLSLDDGEVEPIGLFRLSEDVLSLFLKTRHGMSMNRVVILAEFARMTRQQAQMGA